MLGTELLSALNLSCGVGVIQQVWHPSHGWSGSGEARRQCFGNEVELCDSE